MADVYLKDRAAITGSTAVNGDVIYLTDTPEVWKVVSNKLAVPISAVIKKMTSGLWAYHSVEKTTQYPFNGGAPDFSTSKTYNKGDMVTRSDIVYVATKNISAGSFKRDEWMSVQNDNQGEVFSINKKIVITAGSSTQVNSSTEIGRSSSA